MKVQNSIVSVLVLFGLGLGISYAMTTPTTTPTPQENENALEIDALKRELKKSNDFMDVLSREIKDIKNPINRYTDNTTKDIIGQIIQEKAFDIAWRRMVHYLSFWETLDGYTSTLGAGAAASVDGTQLIVTTGGTINTTALVAKTPTWQGLVTFGQRSNFRTTFSLSTDGGGSLSNATVYYGVGDHTADFYGFKMISGNIYGVAIDGGSETTTLLVSTFTNDVYNLEARYYPRTRVDFLVNSALKGSVSATLPTPTETAVNIKLMEVYVKTTEAVNKTLQTSFWEYLQERNVLKF